MSLSKFTNKLQSPCTVFERVFADSWGRLQVQKSSTADLGWKVTIRFHSHLLSYHAGLFLFAAGNNGQYTDGTDITQQFFPADYGLPNQISVGASDTNDALASFSNYGA